MSVPFVTHDLLDDARIAHGFFGRQGGVSTGIFSSLNAGLGSNDDPAAIQENRARIAQALGGDRLLTMHQIHSSACVPVTGPWAESARPQADAMATDKAGIVIGVLTADCAPVLFVGEKENGAPVIGAAHAGWGGALGGVLAATVAEMERLGAAPARIRAVVGPCIGPQSYEVGAEFITRFIAEDVDFNAFFRPSTRAGHYMFDLPSFAAARLRAAGVGRVAVTGLDTYAAEDAYFSYRRTTHRQEPDYGRQISALMIRPA